MAIDPVCKMQVDEKTLLLQNIMERFTIFVVPPAKECLTKILPSTYKNQDPFMKINRYLIF